MQAILIQTTAAAFPNSVSGVKHEKEKVKRRVGNGEVLNSLRQLKDADVWQTPGTSQHCEQQLLFI